MGGRKFVSRRMLIVSAAIILLAIGGFWLGVSTHSTVPNGGLRISPERLDFGEVWVQDDFVYTLPIQNVTDADIEIERFATSCNCTRVQPGSLMVPARSTVDVRVHLDLNVRDGETIAGDVRPFMVTVRPLVRDGLPLPPLWELTGRVRSAFRLSPPIVHFREDTIVAGSGFPTAFVQVECFRPLQNLTAESNTYFAAVSVSQDMQNQRLFTLDIQPNAELPTGRHESNVKLRAVTAEGESLPTVTLRLLIPVVDDLAAEPKVVTIGAVRVGTTVEETVTIYSRSGENFTVERASADTERIAIEAVDGTDASPAAAERQIRFSVRVSKPGLGVDEVRFVVRPVNSDVTKELTVKVVYHCLSDEPSTETSFPPNDRTGPLAGSPTATARGSR